MNILGRNFINRAKPLHRGFYVPVDDTKRDLFKLKCDDYTNKASSAKTVIVNADGSVVPGPGKAHSGSFSWIIRDMSGVLMEKKMVYIPWVTNTTLLEGLGMFHSLTSKHVVGSTVFSHTDCGEWVSKLGWTKEDYDRGRSLNDILKSRASGYKKRFKLIYVVAYSFVKAMYSCCTPDSGVHLINSSDNFFAHHLANGIRAYFWQKEDERSKEFDEEVEYVDIQSEQMFLIWLRSLESRLVSSNCNALGSDFNSAVDAKKDGLEEQTEKVKRFSLPDEKSPEVDHASNKQA